MARRMKSRLSGSPEHHALQYKRMDDSAKGSFDLTQMEARNGSCRVALKYLIKAHETHGASRAHRVEARLPSKISSSEKAAGKALRVFAEECLRGPFDMREVEDV